MSVQEITLQITTCHHDGSESTGHWEITQETADVLRGQLGPPAGESVISAEGCREMVQQLTVAGLGRHMTMVSDGDEP